ncbi:MAG: glycoside hydrolase family 15 protein [Candidatus Saccharibacteria bacterium]|nr:glycoside hydrolase family 15 protein [Candidatus Saccharibacteria bacterium]
MQPTEKISQLLKTSRDVLLGCCLDNGAVVAANTDHHAYPPDASDYRYVWPRDASYILYALLLLGEDKRELFAEWLNTRAEDFCYRGAFFRRYATNGAGAWASESFQPDQSGSLLWLFTQGDISEPQIAQAVTHAANGLCITWEEDHFTMPTHDLWEHMSVPAGHHSFLYTLAACSKGLERASVRDSEEALQWQETAKQMRETILKSASGGGHLTRLGSNYSDHLDASLLGLTWPFSVFNDRTALAKTTTKIEEELMGDRGLKRFAGDVYDGRVTHSEDQNEGAGAWPLLTCWLAIAKHELGDHEGSKRTFLDLVESLDGGFIPEQLFTDGRTGVKPLAWSHAMFVIAARKLEYT